MNDDIMKKSYWEALFKRALHAVWETAVATAPATIVITPAMIEHFDFTQAKTIFFVFVAWLLTAIFSGVLSAIKSAKAGMPEIKIAESAAKTISSFENEFDEDEDEEDLDEEGDA
jgi:hypothetical protein